MKYGTWNVPPLDSEQCQGLISSGLSPLAAAVLVSRGISDPARAERFFASAHSPLSDPMLLTDMEQAVSRIRQAVQTGELIAVYGDYDVDGITSTCLLVDFLTKIGATCTYYIPARLEEGYGLNAPAVRGLKRLGVSLIVTVDCGITALDEAKLCRDLGMDLIVTDHHECKSDLPDAVAVVDPHRKDCNYPFPFLAGVGVAFKLAAAICGDQQQVLSDYCDLVCLGTVADVMPLQEENRTLVTAGIESMHHCRRVGLLALMAECQIQPAALTSQTIGYVMAPRINAAGRMGKVEIATDLFLTQDPNEAASLAAQLCRLNRQRQTIEADIYADAQQMLSGETAPDAIVLAGENWHQGVVGIVASRLAEEYACPVFLISMSGDHGKASSRSYGGFNLFSALETLSDLLDNFGGHELAAGFTILRENIHAFRCRICELSRAYRLTHPGGAALSLDCAVTPDLLTVENVGDLDLLEPFGAGFSRPQFFLQDMQVAQLSEVGSGRHLKMRLVPKEGHPLGAIFFSTTAFKAAVAEGDLVDVAFTPQINDFRNTHAVQLNLADIRPAESCRAAISQYRELYDRLLGGAVTVQEAGTLLPPRSEFAAVWRYLSANSQNGSVRDEFTVLSRKIARSAQIPCSFARTRVCLDVLSEQGLIDINVEKNTVHIKLTPASEKVDLSQSEILTRLKKQKAGEL